MLPTVYKNVIHQAQQKDFVVGWFMSSTISDHSKYLEPLHAAIGDKCKASPINWTTELIADFRDAQNSLKKAKPLTVSKSSEQLYMTSDASTHTVFLQHYTVSDKTLQQTVVCRQETKAPLRVRISSRWK